LTGNRDLTLEMGREMEGECEAIRTSPSKGAEVLGVAVALALKLVDVHRVICTGVA
jgi:hypothetical protein